MAIATGLAAYIPHLLALSASSPYWVGHDTGLASSRSKVFEGLPNAGLPEPIESWEDFEGLVGTLVSAEAISTIREIWWDVRPHPDFGTVELRMCDGIPTMGEIAAIAALCQSLVERLDRQLDAGLSPRAPKAWVLRQNKWRAARHGLRAEIIVDESGGLRPLRQAIEELLLELAPTAACLGCADELAGVAAILRCGSSADRQRQVVADGGTLVDVVRMLVGELAGEGGPLP